jgi:hypothetical protein
MAASVPVVIASDQSAVTIAGPTLTKGTQGSTGFSVQNLKDAGRTNLRFYATAAAAGATTVETMILLTKSSGTGTVIGPTGSFLITNNKIFRMTGITFATRGHATATIQTTTFSIRLNTNGSVISTSSPVILQMRSATPLLPSAFDRVYAEIPDGLEIAGDGTTQFGVTGNATFTTNAPTWDVAIIGFEY